MNDIKAIGFFGLIGVCLLFAFGFKHAVALILLGVVSFFGLALFCKFLEWEQRR